MITVLVQYGHLMQALPWYNLLSLRVNWYRSFATMMLECTATGILFLQHTSPIISIATALLLRIMYKLWEIKPPPLGQTVWRCVVNGSITASSSQRPSVYQFSHTRNHQNYQSFRWQRGNYGADGQFSLRLHRVPLLRVKLPSHFESLIDAFYHAPFTQPSGTIKSHIW